MKSSSILAHLLMIFSRQKKNSLSVIGIPETILPIVLALEVASILSLHTNLGARTVA